MSARSEQIEALRREFDQASGGLHACAVRFDDATWTKRPAPERWSAAECVAHLNLTARGFLPVMDQAIAGAEGAVGTAGAGTRRLRPGFVGGLLCKILEPPVRMRVTTTPPFVPSAGAPRETTLRTFDELQAQILARLERAAPLDMDKIRVQSIFNKAVHYNLYACFKVIVTHERRHIWQMEQVLAARDA